MLGPMPPTPLRHHGEWGLLALYRDSSKPDLLRQGEFRGPENEAVAIDDSLLKALTRLRDHFDVVQALRFAHTKQD
jgi:hypothetical protein